MMKPRSGVVVLVVAVAVGATAPAQAYKVLPEPVVVPVAAPLPVAPPVLDAAGAALVKKARKATGKKALAAWAKVQALDPDHSEARFGIAAAYVKLKQPTDAITALQALAASARTDALEFLVEARTAKAFKPLAADPAFVAAVAPGRYAREPYELLMGRSADWTTPRVDATDCVDEYDTLDVDLTFRRDRTFSLTGMEFQSGEGEQWHTPHRFGGTWRFVSGGLELTVAAKKKKSSIAEDTTLTCTFATVSNGSFEALREGKDTATPIADGLRCALLSEAGTPTSPMFMAAPVAVAPRVKPRCK